MKQYDDGRFLCHSCVWLTVQLTTVTKENSFFTVNHSNKGKFLCYGEPLQQKKDPYSLRTTVPKKNYNKLKQKTQKKNVSCQKIGITTKKACTAKEKIMPSNI